MDIATINQKIIAFAEAWKNAEQNAQIMCGQPTTEMVDACAERMSVLDETEDDFWRFAWAGQPTVTSA